MHDGAEGFRFGFDTFGATSPRGNLVGLPGPSTRVRALPNFQIGENPSMGRLASILPNAQAGLSARR